MENRNGLVVDADTDDGHRNGGARGGDRDGRGSARRAGASRWAATRPTTPRTSSPRCGRLGVTPHVAQNTKGRRSAIDGRTTRHAGYAVSLRVRKRIEEVFGWIKTVAGCARPVIAAPPGWAGCSPSPRPPTTWCVSPSFWLARRSHARTLSAAMTFARQHSRNRQNDARNPIRPPSNPKTLRIRRNFPHPVQVGALTATDDVAHAACAASVTRTAMRKCFGSSGWPSTRSARITCLLSKAGEISPLREQPVYPSRPVIRTV